MKLHVDKKAEESVASFPRTLKPERDMATGSIKPEWEKRGLNYDTEYISSRD